MDASPPDRIPSHPLANVWTMREPAQDAPLPPGIAGLGDTLCHALQSGGALGQAYTAFADRAFASPSTVQAASHFLAHLFASEQGALVNLVRTTDLLTELEHQCSELTRMTALRWYAGNMTQRISRFGESLVHHQARLKNPVAAEALAAFAGLLALSKPKRAASLFQLAARITDPPGGKEFIGNLRAWLAAGQLIDPMSPEDRAFWQQCLYQGGADTDWSSAEACAALRALAGHLQLESPCAALFRQTVPPSWWASHMKEPQPAAQPAAAATRTKAPKAPPAPREEPVPAPLPKLVAAPLPVPVAASLPAPLTPVPAPRPALAAAPLPAEPAPPPTAPPPAKPTMVATATAALMSPSSAMPFLAGQLLGMAIVAGIWAIQPDLLSRAFGTAQGHYFSPPPVAAAPGGQAPAASPQVAATPQSPPLSQGDQWRLDQAAKLAASHPALKPWVTKVQDGTWAECKALVEGGHPTAYPTMDDYRVFLKWLMLAPPRDPEVRHAIPKIFVRASPLPDLIDLCEHLSYPGSPAAQDIPILAQIAVAMHSAGLTSDEQKRLHKLAIAP